MKNKMIVGLIASAAVAAAVLVGCATEKSESQTALMAQAQVSKETARQTALAKAPGGTVKAAELEKENGKLQWSFELNTPGTSDITEVNVDAITGDVISVDKESAAAEAKEKD